MLFQASSEFDATLFGAFPQDVHSTPKFRTCIPFDPTHARNNTWVVDWHGGGKSKVDLSLM